MLNSMLQNVGLSCIFKTNQQLEYDIYEYSPYWLTDGPWYNNYICKKIHGTVFEKYIRNAGTDR